ncbi:MAG TPA: hypothetical protein VG844_08375 [Terracidiphilus sp.]|nr:hypothetical protein [Terracidiphilus sp.]
MSTQSRAKKKETIAAMLAPGRPLDVGRAKEVAELLLARPRLARQVVECLWSADVGVANRAADALERVSYYKPEILAAWKDALLGRLVDAEANKLRWNLALTIPRTRLTVAETERVAAVLRSWLDDRSSIVKTASMHGLAGLTQWNAALLPEVLDMLRVLSRSGTPAMRARGRILLKKLEKPGKTRLI